MPDLTERQAGVLRALADAEVMSLSDRELYEVVPGLANIVPVSDALVRRGLVTRDWDGALPDEGSTLTLTCTGHVALDAHDRPSPQIGGDR